MDGVWEDLNEFSNSNHPHSRLVGWGDHCSQKPRVGNLRMYVLVLGVKRDVRGGEAQGASMKILRNVLIILAMVWCFWWVVGTKAETWYWLAAMCSVIVIGATIVIFLSDDK